MSMKGTPDGMCRADLDGGYIRQIIRVGNTYGIALDPIERKLYFSKPQGDILRADLNGSGVETLAKVDRPDVILDITLDPVRRKIYWYENAGVTRANIDGTDRVSIIAEEVYHLAMDEEAGRLYWSGASGIHRGRVDGTEAELLVDGGEGSPLVLLYPESTAPQRQARSAPRVRKPL